jgi:energy-coupling factor transport system ATP-binding protein
MELISCQNVSFTYPGCERQVLRDVSFTIQRSEFVVLCGRSGCGKSTLLRHLKKELMPYGRLEGSICYCGQEVEELPDRVSAAEIGFVRQDPDNQIVTDRVWHEMAFGLESLGLDNRTMKRRVAEMASFFGIQTWFRKGVGELSGGQKQLLNLASVMVMQPKLLILDEPTSQLDPIAASEFLAALKKINTELGTTILISEHRLEELFPLADRVLVMEEGCVAIHDTPRKTAERMVSGECGDLFCGLPAVVKIASAVGGGPRCPLTVREGRLWLEERMGAPALGQEGETPKHPRPQPDDQRKGERAALSMRDVWFRYAKTASDTLRGVELTVERGELFALLGGNGVGKTTTLKALTRQIKPYRGTIEIGGKRLDSLSDAELFRQGLAMLPQNPQALFTEITVGEELLEALSDEALSASERQARVAAMAEEMGLSALAETHPYDLSGGEQQRLALGKILLRRPSILLLDEPTKGLDPYFKQTLAKILHRLLEQGVTILMVTHDIEFSAEYASRCALFFDGEIVACGTPKEFFAGNSFYTTAANRVAGQWFPDAVTWEEVAARCVEAIRPLK